MAMLIQGITRDKFPQGLESDMHTLWKLGDLTSFKPKRLKPESDC